MNTDFEDIRRSVETLIAAVQPNDRVTVSRAITAFIVSIPADKVHRAGEPVPRIREVKPVERVHIMERVDNWKGRNGR